MLTATRLRSLLDRIDGRGYKAYHELLGSWELEGFTLFVDHVQADPFAPPSLLRVRLPADRAGLPGDLWNSRDRRVALEDFLARSFAAAARRVGRNRHGLGRSGVFRIDAGGQEVLERTAVRVTADWVEARFTLGLPAYGRRIAARAAGEMLLQELPAIVEASLRYANLDPHRLRDHVDLYEDQKLIQGQLAGRGLVAFVGDGSILPRESGVSDRPLPAGQAVPFRSPPELRVSFETLHNGVVSGMGVPRGVTLIVGGGYHGKSTLLRALERGVYPHIRGDGREFVLTDPGAVKIRSEDGRRVERVDISPFIDNLPLGRSTTAFSTEDASGSTSQAANIMEALEMGAVALLIDEDTSATNFMIRDARMQQLVAKEKEPITPFVDKVRQLADELGVSTVLVAGGSGDYFDVADTVILMDEYVPRDVTARAREIAGSFPTRRRREGGERFGPVPARVPLPQGLDPSRGGRVKVGARSTEEVRFGWEDIDLSAVEQLVDPAQARAIGDMLYYAARRYVNGRRTLREVVGAVMADVEQAGLEVISPPGRGPRGAYALPRPFEVAAAFNRLRTLTVR